MIPVSRPSIGNDELQAVKTVFDSHWLGLGATTKHFEDAISEFLGGTPRTHVIAVNTGTTALHLALAAAGIQPGDEVILPSLTFVATAQAISELGARPVFCDVVDATLNMDPKDLERCITPRSKAVIPVHYRGLPCDMDAILSIAHKHKLRIIEDAAHAFGSQYKNKRIGSFGDLVCFSFDPIKNITCGEGGAVTTRDAVLAEMLRRKRILGIDKDTWSRYRNERSWFYDVIEQGYRYHLSNINAAIGLVQLKKFPVMNQRKQAIAQDYDRAFAKLPGLRVIPTSYTDTAIFTYILRVENSKRDDLMKVLKDKGIDSGIHYIPVHQFTFYKPQAKRPLPNTDRIYSEILTLPLFPDMTEDQAKLVIDTISAWASRSSAS